MRPNRAVASFDSASTFLRVLARHLHGQDSPALGLGPAARAAAHVLPVVNRLPRKAREAIYIWSGWSEAIPGRWAGDVDTEDIARWVVGQYPRRRYPAVLIGSSSGAITHLAALAGIPWLPQTFLVPVRHGGLDPDQPAQAVTGLAEARAAFVEANPGVAVHHMHDANQDRLMIQHMGYFRFKYRDLPAAYREFLRECLEPGGTVLVVDCAERWPTTRVGPRQVFQHGAVGGMAAAEYQSTWDGPAPDGESPEAEWGFDPALLDDLTRLCANENWNLERLTFPRADAISGPVADMYRAWYDERGVPANRLLVGSFALIDAHLPLTRGLVPYWTLFGTDPARRTLEAYLRDTEPYDEIHLGLFSHGTCSIGLATIEEWETVLRHASRRGTYCGVDPAVYPQDFASNHRFHARAATLPATDPAPGPASWPWVHRWLPALRLGNPTRVTT